MRRVMVRYKVKPDRVEENVAYVQKVFAELAESRPAGLRYATFRLPDGVSFVHIAHLDDAANNPLPRVEAFKAFSAKVAERCDEPPQTFDLTEVGAYRFFGAD